MKCLLLLSLAKALKTLNNTHQEFFQKVLELFKKVLDVFGKTLEEMKKGQCDMKHCPFSLL